MNDDAPVAGIVQVGADAPTGDVVIAVAAISSEIDKKISVSTERDGKKILLTAVHNTSQKRMATVTICPADNGLFEFDIRGWVRAQSDVLGELFKDYADLATFATAIGFCPKTSTDLFSRLESANDNLVKLLKIKYPNVVLCNFDVPKMIEEKKIHWADGIPTFPKGTLSITQEALSRISDMRKIQALLSIVVAEAIAVGVRTTRMYDLSEMYPALRLDSNLGYGCRELYNGLLKFPSVKEKGLRGELTEAWISHAESTMQPSRAAKKDDSESPARPAKPSAPRVSPGAVGRDSTGREVMGFDSMKATTWSDELNGELTKNSDVAKKWSQWTRDFVKSIHAQLQTGRRLTGRQMYVLSEVYAKKGW